MKLSETVSYHIEVQAPHSLKWAPFHTPVFEDVKAARQAIRTTDDRYIGKALRIVKRVTTENVVR